MEAALDNLLLRCLISSVVEVEYSLPLKAVVNFHEDFGVCSRRRVFLDRIGLVSERYKALCLMKWNNFRIKCAIDILVSGPKFPPAVSRHGKGGPECTPARRPIAPPRIPGAWQ